MAVHFNNAGPREPHFTALSFRVISKIERLRPGEREDVVKDGIGIGELHSRPDRKDQKRRLESPVSLFHGCNGRGSRFKRLVRLQPDRNSLKLACFLILGRSFLDRHAAQTVHGRHQIPGADAFPDGDFPRDLSSGSGVSEYTGESEGGENFAGHHSTSYCLLSAAISKYIRPLAGAEYENAIRRARADCKFLCCAGYVPCMLY